MSADPYSAAVRRLFAAPEHAGDLDDGVTVGVEDQGVRLQLSAVTSDGFVTKLAFRAWACPHLLAACEAFCAGWEGRPVSELDDFGAAAIMQTLAIPLAKTGRILVLEDAVRSLGRAVAASS